MAKLNPQSIRAFLEKLQRGLVNDACFDSLRTIRIKVLQSIIERHDGKVNKKKALTSINELTSRFDQQRDKITSMSRVIEDFNLLNASINPSATRMSTATVVSQRQEKLRVYFHKVIQTAQESKEKAQELLTIEEKNDETKLMLLLNTYMQILQKVLDNPSLF